MLLAFLSLSARAQSVAGFAGGTYDRTLSEEWVNVLFNGMKVGFTNTKTEQGAKGFRITSRSVVQMEVLDEKQEISFTQTFYLGPDKSVRGFVSLKTIQGQRMQTVAEISGGQMLVETTGIGGSNRYAQKIPPGMRFLETLDFSIKDFLRPGAKMTFPVFITDMRSTDEVTVEMTGRKNIIFGGEKVEAIVLETRIHGLTVKSYYTPEGVKLKEESALGFISVKTTEAEALKFSSGAVSAESIISMSLIKPDKPIVDQESIKTLRITVGGLEGPVTLPADDRQKPQSPFWKKGTDGKSRLNIPVIITRQRPAASFTVVQAMRARPEAILPSPEVQSDNKMILKEAKKIVGAEKDAYKAAVLINRWVFSNVRKKLVDSISAVDTLLSREGECQSHTNLFAALARSVGIPVRIAGGVVYSPQNEGFLYHVWPEVYAGEWIAMDPTFGQDTADATHIKLINDVPENMLKLFQFLIKMTVSVDQITN